MLARTWPSASARGTTWRPSPGRRSPRRILMETPTRPSMGTRTRTSLMEVDAHRSPATYVVENDELVAAPPPYFELRWPRDTIQEIGTIKLWNRQELQAVSEVQALTLEAFGLYPEGGFKVLLISARRAYRTRRRSTRYTSQPQRYPTNVAGLGVHPLRRAGECRGRDRVHDWYEHAGYSAIEFPGTRTSFSK